MIAPAAILLYGRHQIAVQFTAQGRILEGKGVFDAVALTAVLSLAQCLIGFILGAISHWRTRPPRPAKSAIELAMFAIPPLLWWLLAHPIFLWLRSA